MVSPMIMMVVLKNMAFSRSAKKEMKDVQGNRCWCCGGVVKLEAHHRIPESFGGSNSLYNCVGLCGPENKDCHALWDLMAATNVYFPKERMPMLPDGKWGYVINPLGPLLLEESE